MDRREAIELLKPFRNSMVDQYGCPISDVVFALDLAIEALKREIEYGQIVVDFTKGEIMKSNEWKYDTTCDAESATTTDCNDCIWNTCNYNKIDWDLEVSEDCISRQDAIEALDRIGSLDTEADREYARGIFDNIPPVTPTERTGEWIDDCTCSNCNWLNEDDDGRILLTTYNYCPNCGAKMDKGKNNE